MDERSKQRMARQTSRHVEKYTSGRTCPSWLFPPVPKPKLAVHHFGHTETRDGYCSAADRVEGQAASMRTLQVFGVTRPARSAAPINQRV